MKTVGSLILLFGVSVHTVFDIIATDDLTEEAQSSNNLIISEQVFGGESVTQPIFTVFG